MQHLMPSGISKMIKRELQNQKTSPNASEAVEKTLNFLRRWGEFNFPKYLAAINDIQKYVFEKFDMVPGDYQCHLFL